VSRVNDRRVLNGINVGDHGGVGINGKVIAIEF
jgi:hypothetical protein